MYPHMLLHITDNDEFVILSLSVKEFDLVTRKLHGQIHLQRLRTLALVFGMWVVRTRY